MLMVFLGLAIGSFLGLSILLILGIDHEVEVGHDLEVGHDIDIGHGVDVGHEVPVLGDAGPSALSLRLLLFFILGFGVFGIIAMKVLNLSGITAILFASGGALLCYFAAYGLLKALWKQQISTQFSIDSLVGTDAIVTQNIKPGGIGEIKGKCPETGLENFVQAKAANPEAGINKGEFVTVKSVVAGICLVETK
jgi:hypothetical protein